MVVVFVGVFMPVPFRASFAGERAPAPPRPRRRSSASASSHEGPAFDMPLDNPAQLGLRRPLRIALLRSRNPFNIGAIIRVAHSFLVREILLIGTERYYERARWGWSATRTSSRPRRGGFSRG